MAEQIRCTCPSCKQGYSLSSSLASGAVKCSRCGTTFNVADATDPATQSRRSGTGRKSTTDDNRTAQRSTQGGGSGKGAASAEPAQKVGEYTIRRKLGEGAFGLVYLGYHEYLDIEVAVKMLNAEALNSPQSLERFHREAKVLAKMNHPNVLRVYNAGQHGSDYYIASDYIPGRDLADVVTEEGMEPRRAVKLVLQMVRALGYAHSKGIVHRDVKPSNARLDDEDKLYLMDFGLAGWAVQEVSNSSAAEAMRLTRAGAVMGTPAYMAPEQAAGLSDQASPETDLYSAGVVLFELLTGQLPFGGATLIALFYNIAHTLPEPPSHLRPEIPEELDRICLKAMAKQPEERYRSAEEFAADLEAWLVASGSSAESVLDVLPVGEEPIARTIMEAVPAELLKPPPPKPKSRQSTSRASTTRPAPAPRPAPARPAPVEASPARGGRSFLLLAGIGALAFCLLACGGLIAGMYFLGGPEKKSTTPATEHEDFWKGRDNFKH